MLLLVVAVFFSVINVGQGAPTYIVSKYNTIPLPNFEGDITIGINGTLKPNYERLSILCPDEEPLEIEKIEEAVSYKNNGEIMFSLEIQIKRREGVLGIYSALNSAMLTSPKLGIDLESLTYFVLSGEVDKLHTIMFSFT